MYFNVKVYINDTEVDSDDLPDYEIKCPAIDRIINSILEKAKADNDIEIMVS